MRFRPLALLVVLSAPTLAVAQTEFYDLHGTRPGDAYGTSMANIGDVDGDGFDDWVFGVPRYPGFGPWWWLNGCVRVVSGIGGELIYEIVGEFPFIYDRFGFSVAAVGDVDKDGTGDFIVGAPGRDFTYGEAFVFSGATGTELFCFIENTTNGTPGESDRFGWSVGCAGDVDRDGYPDLIVGAPWAGLNGNHAGMAQVFSGADGTMLFQVLGFTTDNELGTSVSGGARVDDDGHDDFIAGAPGSAFGGLDSGRVLVYSGMTGAQIRAWDGQVGERLGTSVSTARDLDSDFRYEVIAGGPGSGAEGTAYLFAGDDSSVQFTFDGWRVSDMDDTNGDGVSDLLVGSDAAGGTVRVYSGQDGTLLQTVTGTGSGLGAAGDLNGDGLGDFLTGEPTDNQDRGSLVAHLGGPGEPGTPLCFGDGPEGPCPCPAVPLLQEDFNGGVLPAGWSVNFGPWHVTGLCAGCGAADPYLYFGYTSSCTYQDFGIVSGTVKTPSFSAPSAGTLRIGWCNNLIMEDGYEQAWFRVLRQGGETEEFFMAPWLGSDDLPLEVEIAAGQQITLEWEFDSGDSFDNGYPGWHIDDLVVTLLPNFADQGEGCRNSTAEGGRLTAHGSTSVGADDLVLIGSQLPNDQSAIYFVGDTQFFPAFTLGAGLICTGGNARRYPGQSTGPLGATTLTNPVAGSLGLIQAGTTYTFQLFYRDLYPESPCGGPANVTNAYEVTYGP